MNNEYFETILKELFAIDSPSGYCKKAVDYIAKKCDELNVTYFKNEKGNLYIPVDGKDNAHSLAFSGHVDTLGLMVRAIKSNGNLAITKVGGPLLNTLDGEYCRVYTRSGKYYTGTILSTAPSVHVFKDSSSKEHIEENMEVRLDEVVSSKEDVVKLGIENGDYIAYDPKTVICDSGYIKSRFLDDKLSVCILMSLLEYYKVNHIVPERGFYICISTYEEVGHGASWLPEEVKEFISVDMGCIGDDLSCTERDVSICAKDSGGPYDYEITTTMSNLAKENHIRHAVDIYPYYGSDTGAALRGGNNIKGGLIGPGVAASHGMERSHKDAVLATFSLLDAYINR